MPVTPAIPDSLGIRSGMFLTTAVSTIASGTVFVALVLDTWSLPPAGSWFGDPTHLLCVLQITAILFGLGGFLCQLQLVRCRRATGVRRRRPWADPLIPVLIAPAALAMFSVATVLTYTGQLPIRIWSSLFTIERVSLVLIVGFELAAVVLVGRLLADLISLLNSIDRDWWRR